MTTGQFESFLQFHANWKAAYKYCCFAYLASKHGGAVRLIQGTLFFRHLPFGFGPHRVETEHVLAGTLTFQGGYEQAVTILRGGRRPLSTEEIIHKLREADVMIGQGRPVAEATKQTATTDLIYFRWRKLPAPDATSA